MKHRRPTDRQAYEEGRKAAEAGKPYRDQCHYEFRFCNCTQEEFEDRFRVKCESWFRGWQEALAAAGVPPTHEARRWCKGDGEWTNWQPVPPDKLAERRADPSFEVRAIAGVDSVDGSRKP